MPSFKKDYGRVNNPINAIIYELTNGGETVLRNPKAWHELRVRTYNVTRIYPELSHYSRGRVYGAVDVWLWVNEGKYYNDYRV